MTPQRDLIFPGTGHGHLPLATREAYLADLQGWVLGMCRAAAKADYSTVRLIEGLFGTGGSAASLAPWHGNGPHASIRREFQLSEQAVQILLLAAAPYLWGSLTHVYAAITRPQSCLVGVRLLTELLGDRGAVMRELCREAPLVRHGLVRVHATGAIVASSPVIARLAS